MDAVKPESFLITDNAFNPATGPSESDGNGAREKTALKQKWREPVEAGDASSLTSEDKLRT